jgi:hypothetical protein
MQLHQLSFRVPVIALDFLKHTEHAGSKIEDLFDTFGLPASTTGAPSEASELVGIPDRFEAAMACHVRKL